jgi:nicotinic acid mononucleotide adenylyltransferase
MARNFLILFLTLALCAQRVEQSASRQPPATAPGTQLPNGQPEEILKQDHKKNLADAAAMAKLAEEVSEDLEKDDRFVYSLKTMKKLDEIEKLTKAIRGRLKKY